MTENNHGLWRLPAPWTAQNAAHRALQDATNLARLAQSPQAINPSRFRQGSPGPVGTLPLQGALPAVRMRS